MTLRAVVAVLALLSALALPGPALAALPALVPITGVLHTSGGGPAPDGFYGIKVKLYDGPDAAAKASYTEVFAAAAVTGGRFQLVLGTGANGPTLPPGSFAGDSVWIGVTVGGDPELPRMQILPVPLALHAAQADQAAKAAVADKALLADQATTADEAKLAVLANQAKGLACTGCVTLDMLDDVALSAKSHTAIYAGKAGSVQNALGGLEGRLDGLETQLTATGGQLGVGNPNPVCGVDLGAVCASGLPAKLVVAVPDAAAMQAVPGDGVVVFRKDTGKYYGKAALGWRAFRFEPFCGDKVVEAEEECDDGAANADAPDKCRTTCKKPACGDAIQDAGEQCDDGNPVATDACVPGCKAAKCGDGNLQAGVETCDDGNASDTDACTTACKPNVCGDGKVHAGVEECDDGNTQDGDGCTAGCKSEVSPTGCSDGSDDQPFSANMVGCNGNYTSQNMETACAKGWHVANPNEYFSYGGKSVKPSQDRWVDTAWNAAGKDQSLKSWQGYYECSNSGGWDGLCQNSDCTWLSRAEQCVLTFANHNYGTSWGCHCRGGVPTTSNHGVMCVKDAAKLPRL